MPRKKDVTSVNVRLIHAATDTHLWAETYFAGTAAFPKSSPKHSSGK
jgi:TolB-like protein